ncbi:MAG: hypothetical protein L6416_01345 [Candidatus Omnitrophica bacterium]|nr:hypothetical protein [Candidatus Omnitrophota bacterium]
MHKALTNISLSIIAVVLILILNLLMRNQNNNRFSFQVHSQTREVYVFDEKTGTLFLTSPEVVGDYSDEIWVKLNPTVKDKTFSFREFLQDTSRRKLRKEFLNKKKQIEKQSDE